MCEASSLPSKSLALYGRKSHRMAKISKTRTSAHWNSLKNATCSLGSLHAPLPLPTLISYGSITDTQQVGLWEWTALQILRLCIDDTCVVGMIPQLPLPPSLFLGDFWGCWRRSSFPLAIEGFLQPPLPLHGKPLHGPVKDKGAVRTRSSHAGQTYSELQWPGRAHVFPASKPCAAHWQPLDQSFYGHYMPVSVSNFCSPLGGSKIVQR